MPKKTKELIPENQILKIILFIRGEKVILDSDLAALYGVETRRLNEQVRRNKDKFPEDFMFQLTQEEFANLKSQIATSSLGWGGRRKAPLVFTEHGALQAANVIKSAQANKMSVYIVRTFVRLRAMALTNEKLARKVDQLENRVGDHDELLIELVREIRILEIYLNTVDWGSEVMGAEAAMRYFQKHSDQLTPQQAALLQPFYQIHIASLPSNPIPM